MRVLTLGVFLLLLLPVTVFAQGNPSNPADFTRNPYPAMPWSGITNPKMGTQGSVIRQIEVPPQQVVVPVYVPAPGSLPGEYQQQVVEIPGYVITETTTGYIYPERVSLQEVTPGVYQWVRVPQQFQPK